MPRSYNNVYKVLKYILFNPDCHVSDIAAAYEYSELYVIEIIEKLLDFPNLGFTFDQSHEFYNADLDFDKHAISKAPLRLKPDSAKNIPLEGFTDKENLFINALMKSKSFEDYFGTWDEEVMNLKGEDSMMFIMDDSEFVPEMSKAEAKVINKLMHRKKKASIRINSKTNKAQIGLPLCFLKESRTKKWYLFQTKQDEKVSILPLEQIVEVAEYINSSSTERIIKKSRQVRGRKDLSRLPYEIQRKADDKGITTVLKVENYPTVLEKLKNHSEGSYQETPLEDGKLKVTLLVRDLATVRKLILRLGSAVEVIEPEELRQSIIVEIIEALGISCN